jgi:hypothetical protein
VYKFHENTITDKFVTGYEFQALGTGLGVVGVNQLVTNVVNFEKAMTRNTIQFDRAVVSTWAEEPGGYDPDQFVVIDLEGTGTVTGSSADLPLEAALFVRRVVSSGRQGKLFLRGYLSESDVENNSGQWVLSDPSGIQGVVDTAISTSITGYLGGTAVDWQMVLHGANKAGTLYTRPVLSLGVVGVTWAKRSRKHYDRSS